MFHLSVKPISRSSGRSATAAAAYRAGAQIADLRTGELHDYTRKRDIVHSEIVLPAGSPAWAQDRSSLWNAAEAAEKRKDARVARDYEVAIPKEITPAQGIELVRDFSQVLVDRYGVAVDFNIHRDDLRKWDGSDKGWQGYHAHILTSTRKLGREGFGAKAEIELSDTKRKSLGLSDGATEIERIREMWEVAANRHLEQANQAQRIDRRSLKDQGIDREPTVHLGPGVTALERHGIPSRLGDINRQVVAERHFDRQVVAEGHLDRQHRHEVDNRPVSQAELKEIRVVVNEALDRLYRQRDQRVQRVLAKAQAREIRRAKAYRTVQERAPVAPKGLRAAFQQKGHQQALAAWQAAKDAAAKLVEQAKRLATRILELAKPQRLAAWAQGHLQAEQLDLIERHTPALEAEQLRQQTVGEKPARETELQRLAPSPRGLELDIRSPVAKPPVQAGPEQAGPNRTPLEAATPHAPEPVVGSPVAPPKRDWNRYKALQQELAKKGLQSLRERGVVPGRDGPERTGPDRDPPELTRELTKERSRNRGRSR